MRIKFLERQKFKYFGRSVPVMKVIGEDVAGRVEEIQLIASAKDRPNSIIETWDGKGCEKDPENPPILVTDDKGTTNRWWVVKGGKSISLYSRMSAFPNREKIIGTGANMDDIAEAMGYHPPLRDKMIFLGIGILAGWLFIAPIMGGVLR